MALRRVTIPWGFGRDKSMLVATKFGRAIFLPCKELISKSKSEPEQQCQTGNSVKPEQNCQARATATASSQSKSVAMPPKNEKKSEDKVKKSTSKSS